MSSPDLVTTTEIDLTVKTFSEKYEERPLSRLDLEYALYDIDETIEGLKIAPKKLICKESLITDIGILSSFKNLQFINLSHNLITDISPLLELELVHQLDCSSNKIQSIPEFSWPFLMKMDLSNNEIRTIPRLFYQSLQILYLSNNLITSLIDEDGDALIVEDNLPSLHTLELRNNLIQTSMPRLEEPLKENVAVNYHKYLYRMGLFHTGMKMLILAGNNIKTLASVYRPPPPESNLDDKVILKVNPFGCRMGLLPNLVVLHLRSNGLKSLQGFTRAAFTSLKYLNLRDNKIQELEDLENLKELVSLEHVVLEGNPVESTRRFPIEVLMLNLGLKRIDKFDYLDEDYEVAKRLVEKRQKVKELQKAEANENAI